MASAAIQLGKRATILEALPTLLHRALGSDLGEVVAGIHRDAGVDVRTGQPVTGLTPRPGGGVQITAGDGPVDADVLVVGVGTVPNTELAAQAGLPVENGIVVDEYFATAVPGVWAVGDVVAQHLPRYGRRVRVEHHDTALRHGRAVARNMLGLGEPFADVHWFWSDQFEHTISSAGLPDTDGPLIIRGSLEQRDFSAFSLDGDRLSAVISLNRPKDVLDVRKLIAREPPRHRRSAARRVAVRSSGSPRRPPPPPGYRHDPHRALADRRAAAAHHADRRPSRPSAPSPACPSSPRAPASGSAPAAPASSSPACSTAPSCKPKPPACARIC